MPGREDKKYFKFWFPVIAYSGIIFYVSSLSNLPSQPGIVFLDKICHIIEYAGWGFLLARALKHTMVGVRRADILLAVSFFALLYGASDEFHQFFVPGREVSLGDLLADGLGGTLGGLLYRR